MKIETIAIEVVNVYGANARKHSAKQINVLAQSIKDYGFNVPILVDRENVVVAGHGRLLAAKQLGLDKVPIIRVAHLTDKQIAAYRLADNQIGAMSSWDKDLLIAELSAIANDIDIQSIGFAEDLLEKMTGELDSSPQLDGGLKYLVAIDVADEQEQIEVIAKLEAQGLQCRPLITR